VLASYADYQHERDGLVGEQDSEMVLVNLYRQPFGAPMTYRAAKGFFDRLAGDARLGLSREQLDALVDEPLSFTGAAGAQVAAVVARVADVVRRHPVAAGYTPAPIL